MSSTRFLDKLVSSKKVAGLSFFENYFTLEESQAAYNVLDGDFPWDLNPTLYGEKLTQHTYEYDRYEPKSNKAREEFSGIAELERFCQKIEHDFYGEISNVFCNRFQDPTHCIPWHKDTYGRHIMVISFGSSRRVEFRDNKTKHVERIEPSSGDMYFMPFRLNDTHQHRVCATDYGENAGTRLSFVFFFKPPKYAKEFRITRMDHLKGGFTALTGIGA